MSISKDITSYQKMDGDDSIGYSYGDNENVSLIFENKKENPMKSVKYYNAIKYAFILSSLLSLLLLLLSKSNDNVKDYIVNFSKRSKKSHKSKIKFTLKRSGYEPLIYLTSSIANTKLTYKFLEDYVAVIEPYSNMELYIEDTKVDDGWSYSYDICKYDMNTSIKSDDCQSGTYSSTESSQVKFACTPFESFYISVSAFKGCPTKCKLKRIVDGYGVCQYVRREIRSLTSDDLNKAMDSMYTLWSVSEEDGQKLYGENYHSSTYFTEAHTFNAGQQDADHIHEGLGFLPQHIKMTNMFEESIQTVDPSFTLPYWDYTIDTEEGLTLDESPMFTSDTFGSIKLPKDSYWGWTYRDDKIEDAVIQDGRWMQLKADKNTRYAFPGNSFGYMRGPWNLNPSPYISRFSISTTRLPSCSNYYNWLQLTSLENFLDVAPYAPHASVHGAVGAVFGCDMLDQMLDQNLLSSESDQKALCKKWGFIMKELYRSNVIQPYSSEECSINTLDYNGITCGYKCDADNLDNLQAALKKQLGTKVPTGLSNEQWDKWVDFVCNGDGYRIFVGDHLESASPADPSFWSVHPNQERLLHAKFMGGGFDNSEWPDKVCDKFECYESKYGSKSNYTECCYGHYQHDQLLDFVNGDINSGYGETNHNVLRYTNARMATYNMKYIYDDLQWSHCSDEENFNQLLVKMLKPGYEVDSNNPLLN